MHTVIIELAQLPSLLNFVIVITYDSCYMHVVGIPVTVGYALIHVSVCALSSLQQIQGPGPSYLTFVLYELKTSRQYKEKFVTFSLQQFC